MEPAPKFPYKILVHWNEFARGFVAKVPALPDCAALAASAAEALSRARRAAEEMLRALADQGKPLPPQDA